MICTYCSRVRLRGGRRYLLLIVAISARSDSVPVDRFAKNSVDTQDHRSGSRRTVGNSRPLNRLLVGDSEAVVGAVPYHRCPSAP